MAAENEDGTEKTEDPTGKRLSEAREKGQVAKSQEVSHWFMLVGGGLVLAVLGQDAAVAIANRLLPFLERPHDFIAQAHNLHAIIIDTIIDLGVILMPILAIMVAAALAGNLLQHGFVFSPKKLEPKPKNLSLVNGLKKKFSSTTVTEFLKSAVKLLIIATAAGIAVAPQFDQLPILVSVDLSDLLGIVRRMALIMIGIAILIMAVIAVADLLFQRYTHIKQLRMTKQEVKDEMKQTDGDPQVKRQLAKIRMERARERMMAAVPTSDVVITNPTHFAVALKYDQETMQAPVVVAKGQDNIALKIREIANENEVPIVENPPLARGLYSGVDIDQPIPLEFYKAVAEVISYVMKLKKGLARRVPARGRNAAGTGRTGLTL
jgi:flagellar biosynthetic protein FlhB